MTLGRGRQHDATGLVVVGDLVAGAAAQKKIWQTSALLTAFASRPSSFARCRPLRVRGVVRGHGGIRLGLAALARPLEIAIEPYCFPGLPDFPRFLLAAQLVEESRNPLGCKPRRLNVGRFEERFHPANEVLGSFLRDKPLLDQKGVKPAVPALW